ncbi:MAG: hypothetical protein M0Z72_07525 [Deltaproteobacteria bacterium]|nr:hypothetical protein [Deltaproteobacteria bacterium]
MMKFLLIAIIFLLIPVPAFAGTWIISINQIRPIINYMEKLQRQKKLKNIIKIPVTPPKPAGNLPSAGSLKLGKPGAIKKVVKKQAEEEKPKVKVSLIHGPTAGLPVLTVNFVKTPLWKALQTLSNKTGYMFTSRRVNMGEKITLNGRYNFAELLNKLFAQDTVRIMQAEKKVYIEG